MKHLQEYRDPEHARDLLQTIRRIQTRPWVIMEICGGQTHAIMRHGLEQLLPEGLELVHGPGCPVCVTPLELIDQAHELARRPDVVLASFGDMLRVPGSAGNLLDVRAAGGDVRIVDSPLAALELARQNPGREVVFFAIGFETTAPTTALLVRQAVAAKLTNLSLLVAHVLVPPAMTAILEAPGRRVQGFLAAGHVCTVTGWAPYNTLAARYRVPIVVTGFEPTDLLLGILTAVQRLEDAQPGVENCYLRAVRRDGNRLARAIVAEVFETCDRRWRGLGMIPTSGLMLREKYALYDAARRFEIASISRPEGDRCLAGEVLQGRRRPDQCPRFGRECTPISPLGAPMVSSEGACAAYWRHARVSGAEATS